MNFAEAAVDPQELRVRVASTLENVSARMIRRMAWLSDLHSAGEAAQDETVRLLQARVAELGQLAAGLAMVDASCLPAHGAGYGSLVRVQSLDSREIAEYRLMVGSLVDIDAGQVSLASPVGQALIGREPGDVINIATPQRRVRLRVVALKTLNDILDEPELVSAAR